MQKISEAIVAGSLESIAEEEEKKRREEVKRLYGDGAQVVQGYKPNRKQRRAQAARSK